MDVKQTTAQFFLKLYRATLIKTSNSKVQTKKNEDIH